MTVTYIYHSCFVIESQDTALVFDYYKNGGIIEKLLNNKKTVYVFSSHNHYDHYNPEIFSWREKFSISEFIYILSGDIGRINGALSLNEGETYKDGVISAKAYGSTDCGVSFFIRYEGVCIFHAGDYNNWHWNEGAPPAESRAYENAFLKILSSITAEQKKADIVMFPVDPRLGRDYYKGAEQFIANLKTSLFAPMHFQDDYNKASAFEKVCIQYGTNFFNITKPGDSIRF